MLLLAAFLVSWQSAGAQTKSETPMQRGYADSRFGQIHYRIAHPTGQKAQQPPLIMLHLSPNSGQVFSKVLPLVGRNRIAMAPDYPGYGMSDAIEGEQRIGDYALAMMDALESVGISGPVDLLGYHTGAAVALEMARIRPEQVRKIMLVAVPLLTSEERAAGAALPKIPFDENGTFAQKEWQSSWRWRGPGQSTASVYATFAEKMRPGARERGAEAILAYDLEPVLRSADHPLMIVRVKDDLWDATLKAKQLRPDAEYVELGDYGHGLFHAAPDLMDELARGFLESN